VPRPAVAAAVAIGLLAAAITWAHRPPAEHLSKSAATALALRNQTVRERLVEFSWDRVKTTPIDRRLERVTFFNGARVVLEVAVARDGRVAATIVHRPGSARVGGDVAQRPAVLALLVAAFFIALASAPLRSLRNLDLLALASFVLPVVLMNERLLEASVYASYPPLAYLFVRCAHVGLRGRRPAALAQPLVCLRPRIAVLGAGAAAAALALLAIPGGVVGDVGFASLAGATDLAHGVLPYGHVAQTDLVHGDTYPLLAYAAYVPAAIATPVRSGFDQLDAALWVATGFALLAAVAIRRLGGLRMMLAWLAFPPVVIAASAGSNDLAAAACIAWAAALAVHQARSSSALALAGWVKLAPFAALPVWLARARGRDLRRALLAACAVALAVPAAALVMDGPNGFVDMVHAVSFQAERGSLQSVWALTGADALQAVVQAAVAALVIGAAWQARRDPELAHDARRIGALGAAILLGTQLAANYWSYTYLVWVFPLVALALLRGAPVPRGSGRARSR
jgi:hypothetical protein